MFLERRRVEEMMNLCVYNMYVTYVKEGIKLTTSNVHEMNDDEMISSLNLVIYNICIRVDTVHRCKVRFSFYSLFNLFFFLRFIQKLFLMFYSCTFYCSQSLFFHYFLFGITFTVVGMYQLLLIEKYLYNKSISDYVSIYGFI